MSNNFSLATLNKFLFIYSGQIIGQKVKHCLIVLLRNQFQNLWYFCLYFIFIWLLSPSDNYFLLFPLRDAIRLAHSFWYLSIDSHIVTVSVNDRNRTLIFVISETIILTIVFTIFTFAALPARLVCIEAFTIFF